ncbi:hypothetical protein HK104_008126 [Borealophlyctis nickersoniae]|nr:hypothetical protein HK104_008126 [Borealophlyctis nickersoniae]
MLFSCASLVLLATAANAAFVDYCNQTGFEHIFDRSTRTIVDYRQPVDYGGDSARYKRDFRGGTTWEANTYFTWRFPAPNNRIFLKKWVEDASDTAHNAWIYATSNDNVAYTTVPAGNIAQVASFNNPGSTYWGYDVTITLPRAVTYFRITYPGCPNTIPTCLNYYVPQISHLCAVNTASGETINDRTCYPPTVPVTDPYKPPCGTLVINDYWSIENTFDHVNTMGGTFGEDRTMTYYLNTADENIDVIPNANSYFWEDLRDPATGSTCLDISAYTNFEMTVRAQQGAGFTVQMTTCNGARFNAPLGLTFSATPETKQARIPLSSWASQGADLKSVKQFSFVSWVNPSGGHIIFDNVQLSGNTAACGGTPPPPPPPPGCTAGVTMLSNTAPYPGSYASNEGSPVTVGTNGRFTTFTPTGAGGYYYIAFPACINAASYTHMQLDISGPAGGSVRVGLDWFGTAACTGSRAGVAMSTVTTTATVTTVRIPLSSLTTATNLGRIKSLLLDTFTGTGTFSIDNVAFVTCPATLAAAPAGVSLFSPPSSGVRRPRRK